MSTAAGVRLKLIVAYDGGPFLGWQSQKRGGAIQDHLERAFEIICGRRIPVHGAGRTDAGVHAFNQCAHADVKGGRLEQKQWIAAINAHLPKEIRVLRCTRAVSGFHARFSAKGKVYRYRIWNDAVLFPLEVGRAWHLVGKVDMGILRGCAEMLTGTHDFAGFAANRGGNTGEMVRTVTRIDVRKRGALLTLDFEGTGFLYKMVRLMTGTMIRCAQGKAEPEWIARLLRAKGGEKTSFAAPAEGLYLMRVIY